MTIKKRKPTTVATIHVMGLATILARAVTALLVASLRLSVLACSHLVLTLVVKAFCAVLAVSLIVFKPRLAPL